MNYFGGFPGGSCGCGCSSQGMTSYPTFSGCGCCNSFGSGGYNNSSYYAIILVLFILLVIVIGSRFNR